MKSSSDGWTGRTVDNLSWNAAQSNYLQREEIDKCHGYTVYGHLTPSLKWYFGITKKKPRKRWGRGCNYSTQYFARAIRKYGWDNIYHYIVATGLTKDQACQLERELIAKYNTMNPAFGYNCTAGGDCGTEGYRFTDEQRKRIGERNIALGIKPPRTPKGTPPWNKGKPNSIEARLKMSASHKGVKLSKRHAAAIGEGHKKPVWCLDTGRMFICAKDAAIEYGVSENGIRSVCCGRTATAGGYRWAYINEPHTSKDARKTKKVVMCVETGEIFQSISDAARNYNLKPNAIQNVCAGRSHTSGGLHWKYVDEI